MALFSHGLAPKYLRWVDENLVVHTAARAYLGSVLVFDGTIPAVLNAPRMTATAAMPAPAHRAGQSVSVPPMAATADLTPPVSVVGAVRIFAPPMAATVSMSTPVPAAPASITAPPMAATAALRPATPITLEPGVIGAPNMGATAQMPVPAVSAGAVAAAPPMTGSADMTIPGLAGAVNVVVPPMIATATASPPAISAGATVVAPRAQASAAAAVPAIVVPASVTVPAMVSTASMPIPVPIIKAFYSDNFNRTNASSLGTDWRVDRNSQPKIDTNRAVMKTMGNGDGRAGNWVSYQGGSNSGKFATDNYGVRAQLIAPVGNTASDNMTALVLAVADTFGAAMMCYFVVTTANGCAIYTQSGLPPTSGITTGQTGQTQRAVTVTSIAVTDLIEFQRVGNVFTAYRNSVSFLTWTDTGNLVSTGATNRRWGFAVEGNYPIFNAEFRSPAIDAIVQAYDL